MVNIEKKLSDLDIKKLCDRKFTPSPVAWEDQVLYFLMLDRFSDDKEKNYKNNQGKNVASGTTPMFVDGDEGNAMNTVDSRRRWEEAGRKWVGGTLKGLADKVGYLKRMGVSAIWISPVFKQISFQDTYHGYGVQNFIDVDPHFGSREDLKKMVETAHKFGIYVILDVILNHSGNVFTYDADRYLTYNTYMKQYFNDTRWDASEYEVEGFNDKEGKPVIPFGTIEPAGYPSAWPDGALWPVEFQEPSTFTRKGRISNWDYYPEYLEGDFSDLKDISHGYGPVEDYHISPALKSLCDVYKFWIAYADLDGFRVDTVKHMEKGATRYFSSAIHEFTQSIGKENFTLIGEITGGRAWAYETLEETGLNAALGINDIPDKLEYLVKGYRNPGEYFDLFRNSLLVKKESHVWFRNKVVTMFDDHDQVRKGNNKARFCAQNDGDKLVLNALALNLLTLGIPCIYYGSEQLFDGAGGDDRYLREAMFGGEFGPLRSLSRHCFNENSWVYKEVAKILEIRNEKIALRRGRQYLRPISGDGIHFDVPHMIGREMRSVVPWSRIFNDNELLLAINTDPYQSRSAWVTVDNGLHKEGRVLTCIYTTNLGVTLKEVVVEARNGKAVYLTVPAAGFVIYE